VKFLADENFDGRVIRAIRRRNPGLDLVRAVDVGLGGAADPDVLAWAAAEGRVLLTHDVSTMVGFAYERVTTGLPMPGVVEVPPYLAIGQAVDDLLMLAVASVPGEWEAQVLYLPL
jgi:hypothetical protein